MLADVLRMEATMQAEFLLRGAGHGQWYKKHHLRKKKKLRAKELIKQCMIDNSNVR